MLLRAFIPLTLALSHPGEGTFGASPGSISLSRMGEGWGEGDFDEVPA